MPNLAFSPFLPLTQQLEAQQQQDIIDSNMTIPGQYPNNVSAPLSFQAQGLDDSF